MAFPRMVTPQMSRLSPLKLVAVVLLAMIVSCGSGDRSTLASTASVRLDGEQLSKSEQRLLLEYLDALARRDAAGVKRLNDPALAADADVAAAISKFGGGQEYPIPVDVRNPAGIDGDYELTIHFRQGLQQLAIGRPGGQTRLLIGHAKPIASPRPGLS